MQSEVPKPKRFLAWSVLNRDLCQLEFFRRVLEEATDKTTAALEKLKFLAVFSSNLDEFFMVRVSGIKEMLDIEEIGPIPGELTPDELDTALAALPLPPVEQDGDIIDEMVLWTARSDIFDIDPQSPQARR